MTILIKALVILLLLCIAGALGSALYFLVQDKDQSTRTAKALTWRIVLSLLLFALLIVGFLSGGLTPHSVIWR